MAVSDVNAHLHTPFSFSCFESIPQALDMAAYENVKVVGINDFYTQAGYDQWAKGCEERKLFPLFNIEMISLNVEDQAAGIRVNDPNNPGRTYMSGKGLSYPVSLCGEEARMLSAVKKESEKQVERMCEKLNSHLKTVRCPFELDYQWISSELSCGSVRERHLAKALRIKASQFFPEVSMPDFYYELFGGKALKSSLSDNAALENEIRSKLLKSGGPAFVAESPEAFLPLETVCRIIRAAGGIPTYPFLADDANGNFTDFETDVQQTADMLKKRGIGSVEFITSRNTTEVLEAYASFLLDEGFIVSFGSEHNSPSLEPIRLHTRNNPELSEKLRIINFAGACAIAAHQAGLSDPSAGEELITKQVL